MGVNKKYKGYKSFQYLVPDVDYKAFKMPKAIEWVEPYVLPVSLEEEERVQKLADEIITISLHDHPMLIPEDVMGQIFDYNREGRIITPYDALSKSCWDAIFDNLLDGTARIVSKTGWKWEDIICDLGMKLCDIAHQDFVIVAKTVDDITNAHDEGKIAFIPTLEAATPIENEVDRIDILFGLGIRMMGVTYSESNCLGSGLSEDRDGGLTTFGREVIERYNKIGMAIDVSHSGDQTARDVIEASTKPVFITHVGAKTLWNTKRLKPDEVLQACAKKGGVIGIEAAPHTTITKNHPLHDIESYMEHFEYIVKLVGIGHVAFGPDTMYGDHVALHHAYSKALSIKRAFAVDTEEVPYVKGLENPTEASWNIVRWLVKHGYSDEEIKKVMGENIIGVLREVWPHPTIK